MQVIPLQPLPAQVLNCQLAGQNCRIEIAQKSTGAFLNLYVSDALIIGGVLCEIANRIVRSTYLGFIGDLAFFDAQPGAPPLAAGVPPDQVYYTGFGSRYFLAYLP